MPNNTDLTNLAFAREAAVAAAPKKTVGDFVEVIDEGDNTLTFLFESKQKGYVGWRWSVTIFQGDSAPTVSEVLLMPGSESLVAPKWIPWSERLADYKALQLELEAQAALDAAEADEDEDSDDELDEDDVADEVGADLAVEGSETEPEEDSLDEAQSGETTEAEPESAELAATNLEEGEDSESNAKKARRKPPRFFGRRKRGRKDEA
jgi:hypothetical protein